MRGDDLSDSKQQNNVFSILASPTRQTILRLVAEEDRHVSSLARDLDISVPVVSKHLRMLEDAGFVEKKVFGNTHVYSARKAKTDDAFEPFSPITKLEVKRGTTLMDAFKMVSAIEIKNVGGRNYILSSDGEKGYFVYEVNGEFVDRRAEDIPLLEDSFVAWKRLEPITQRRLFISVVDDDGEEPPASDEGLSEEPLEMSFSEDP